MSLSNTLENSLLNHLFMKAAYSQLSNIFVSVHTGDPGEDGQSNAESFTNGYARVSTAGADWNSAASGSISNANVITFPTASADWASGSNFTHFGLWNHATTATSGAFIGGGSLTVARNCLNGDTLKFNAGQLTATLD